VTQASEVSGRIVFGAWALLLALAAVPIFSTVLPPLADYPNHLARFYLLAQGGNDYYAVRWAPLPNLAGDVIVPALAQAMPLGLAAKVFLVTSFALLTGGPCGAYAARSIRRAPSRWPCSGQHRTQRKRRSSPCRVESSCPTGN
jgi:hypothetical protein